MRATDPVCGMEVDPHTADNVLEYKGKTYYFCTPLCKVQFESKPEEFLAGSPSGESDAEGQTI